MKYICHGHGCNSVKIMLELVKKESSILLLYIRKNCVRSTEDLSVLITSNKMWHAFENKQWKIYAFYGILGYLEEITHTKVSENTAQCSS